METLTLRKAEAQDINFLVKIDLKDEGVAVSHMVDYGAEEFAQRRDKIAAFVLSDDKDAWVFEDVEANRVIGIILWRFRNRLREKGRPECVGGVQFRGGRLADERRCERQSAASFE